MKKFIWIITIVLLISVLFFNNSLFRNTQGTHNEEVENTPQIKNETPSEKKFANLKNKGQEQEFTVYVTPTGIRYHFRPTCAGKNATEVNIQTAKALKYTPCRKCVST